MPPDRFAALATLYAAMDRAWHQVARQYGFLCKGCKDNCCRSLFFHHTFVEKAYLIFGFHQLPSQTRHQVMDTAKAYCDQTFADPASKTSLKLLCPLNQEGQCILYPFRPMICRLHGLPHELAHPRLGRIKAPGCHAGDFDAHPYIPFDRTRFYREMARVETAFRKDKTTCQGKLKETVAQMLLTGDSA
jgi:hypothetical protein